MGEVVVTINGRDYQVSCDDGQEERLGRLAEYVDERFGELVDTVGNIGDLRLMMMTSLLVADKLFEASAEVERLRAQVAQARQAATVETNAAVVPLVDAIAQRIEDIAAHLESA